MRTLLYDDFSVVVPEDWTDITAELEDGAPTTLAKRGTDSGALQFSIALYRSGARPHATTDKLVEMLNAFADAQSLTATTEIRVATNPLLVAGASFTDSEFHVRVWYASDGGGFALVTYTTEIPDTEEVAQAESILRSLKWRAEAV